MQFDQFFQAATGYQPYDYQRRLAWGDCRSRLINIPTGLGKTAAVVLAWLWNRLTMPTPALERSANETAPWPRRLVYCLPMRTLVEQTRDNVQLWLLRLALAATRESSEERTRMEELIGTLCEETQQTVRKPLKGGDEEIPIYGCLAGAFAGHLSELLWLTEHSPISLMGGEELDDARRDWDLYPEKPAILIGTQDMLLSRALNRGYAMSRYRWPMQFGLLNSDCLWVMDEVQLMSSGFSTSLQLQAWRNDLTLRALECGPREDKLSPVIVPTHSWWMSATTAQHWLRKSIAMRTRIENLWKSRIQADPTADAKNLFVIPKTLQRCSIALPVVESGEGKELRQYAKAFAQHLADAGNRKGKKKASDATETNDILTLVVCNTVDRAVAVYEALKSLRRNGSNELLFDERHLFLLHSRFRGNERRAWPDKLRAFEKGDGDYSGPRVVVATQVIEAGVDISSAVLYTELCPLAALIQRLGRCARRAGESGKAFWIAFDVFSSTQKGSPATEFTKEQKDAARPYEAAEIAAAKEVLNRAETAATPAIDVSIAQVLHTLVKRAALDDCPEVRTAFPFDPSAVPQTRDLFNLFDTTPDLSGADIDISRFIRDAEELDVLVFWRDNESGLGKGDFRRGCPFKKLFPGRDELCPVATWRFRNFFEKLKKLNAEQAKQVWVRDYRKGWVRLKDSERIYAGQIFLLHREVGGYDNATGWTGVAGKGEFDPCPPNTVKEEMANQGESTQEDEGNAAGEWQGVHSHSVDVSKALNVILRDPVIHNSLNKDKVLVPLRCTPPWHDVGKAHEKFFAKLTSAARVGWPGLAKGDHPAKGPRDAWKSFFHDDEDLAESEVRFKRRPGFRHELASALALLETLRLASPHHPAIKIEDELRAAFANTPSVVVDSRTTAAALASLGPIVEINRIDFNLLLFLIASHHGKVRLGLRSSEDDYDLDQPDPVPEALSDNDKFVRRCRGVQDQDVVPACRLPDPSKPTDQNGYVEKPLLRLSLDPMEAFSPRYGASWADRMRELLETLGPFRLGYLEALIRAADAQGSVVHPINQAAP